MRGKFLHNTVLISRIAALFHQTDATIYHEYPTGPGRTAGFVDLFILYKTWRFAVEAELSADRVSNDVAKAIALRADLLLIVTPNSRVATAVRRQVQRLRSNQRGLVIPNWLTIWSLPLGPAIQRLVKKGLLKTAVNATGLHDSRP